MDYREMQEIARNPARVRTLAATILGMIEPNDQNAASFLGRLCGYSEKDRLSEREREWLWSLRERTHRSAKAGPYAAWTLVKRVYEARCDLSEDDEDRIKRLYESGPSIRLMRSEWRWIFAILRSWDELDDEWIPLA